MIEWTPTEIPLGQGGINRSKNLDQLQVTDLQYADGVTAERDLLERAGGASLVMDTPLPAGIKGSYEFLLPQPNPGIAASPIKQVAYLDDGAQASIVTYDIGGLAETLISGLVKGGFPMFEEGWNGVTKALYIVDCLNPPMVYDGAQLLRILPPLLATGSDIPKGSVDWAGTNQPAMLRAHKTRMVMWGVPTQPHNLYGSVPVSHSDYTGGESFLQIVRPGTGQHLESGESWQGRLYLWKNPNGLFYLDDTDPNIANWEVIEVTRSVGTKGPACTIPIEDDIVFLAADGNFYALSQIRTLGQVQTPPFLPLETSTFLREKLNLERLDLARAVWYGHKRKILFAVQSTGSTFCDLILELDLHIPGKPKLFLSSRDLCPALWMRKGTIDGIPKPAIGDPSGNVYQLDQAGHSKNGENYTSEFETIPVALQEGGTRRANLKELEVRFQPQVSNQNLDVEVLGDGVVLSELSLSMQTPGAAVGSFSLDSDVLAGLVVANVKTPLAGDCRYVKLIASNSNIDENFAVEKFWVKHTPGNYRP